MSSCVLETGRKTMSCIHFAQLAMTSLRLWGEGKEWESYNWTSATSLTALFLFWIHPASLASLLAVGVHCRVNEIITPVLLVTCVLSTPTSL